MAKMTIGGDLAALLADFEDSFTGGIARWTGASMSVSSGFPYAVTLSGGYISIPSSGADALVGRISELILNEGRIVDLSEPITFETRMEIEGVVLRAENLFDLVSRQLGSVTVQFDHEVFRRALSREDWSIEGSADTDRIAPSARLSLKGDDLILAGGGDDTVSGGRGADRLKGQGGDDLLKGGGGADLLVGGSGGDALIGGGGGDVLRGGGGDDRLVGSGGADRLIGQRGDDLIVGGGGDDRIDGGAGRDRLKGGAGSDVFVFGRKAGSDVVVDFDLGTDRLEVQGAASALVEETDKGVVVSGDFGTVLLSGLALEGAAAAVLFDA